MTMPSTVYLPPYKALKLLPDTATESQKDSVVQAHLVPQVIHYNTRVDTLTVFGLHYQKPKAIREMKLSDEEYFAGNKYFVKGLTLPDSGVMGESVPYTLSGDNLITGLLLGIFIVLGVVLSRNLPILVSELRNFFYLPKGPTYDDTRHVSLPTGILMMLIVSIEMAVFSLACSNGGRETVYAYPEWVVLGVFTLLFLCFFALKSLLYGIVNPVFFGSKKNGQFMRVYFFLTTIGGLLLFPILLLPVYLHQAVRITVICVLLLLLLVKILQSYKAFTIFFRTSGGILQLFLYFCTLELTPLMVLFGIFELIGEYLKVNF